MGYSSVRLRRCALLIMAWVLSGGWQAGPLHASEAASFVDDGIYADLLSKYVKDGFVDYAGFKTDEARLDQYLKILEQVKPESLLREDQFAFYINAYNAWTIKLILSAYPGVKSIKDLGSLIQSPWQKKFVPLSGQMLSLDDIEHGMLRPRFKDPRIHFAVNCASKSCPRLISEPYRGKVLDAQLNAVTRDFLNASANYRLEDHSFWVSSIFKWYPEDFNRDVVGFYRQYAQGELKKALERDPSRIKVKYLEYDWSLNGA